MGDIAIQISLLLATLSLPATLAMIGSSRKPAESPRGNDELGILKAVRVQACLMITLYHLLFHKFFSGIPGGPWDDVVRAICVRHIDVFFVLSAYLAVTRSKEASTRPVLEQIAVSGATLLRRVARTAPFLITKALLQHVAEGRSVWEAASNERSWLGRWPYCQEFVCYAVVHGLLLVSSLFGKLSAVAAAVAGIAYCQHHRMAFGKILPAYEPALLSNLWMRHLPCSLVVFLICGALTRSNPVREIPDTLEKTSRCHAASSCLVHLCYHSGILLTGLLEWCFQFGPCDMVSDWHRPLLHTFPLAFGCFVLLEHHRRSPKIPPSWIWPIEMLDGVSVSWMHIHCDVMGIMDSFQAIPSTRLGLLAQTPSLLAWNFLACKVHTWMVEPYKQAMLKAVVKLEALANRSLKAWVVLIALAAMCFRGSLQLCRVP